MENRDILPYDPDGYMNRISSIQSIDEWEKFYIEQSLKCYNADAFEAALIMLGLAGEYLATKLIEKIDAFLLKNRNIFTSYISDRVTKQESNLSTLLDGAAKAVYATYLRLTRNELAHPSGLKMDRIECLTLMTGYIKYCETQHKYLDFYIANS